MDKKKIIIILAIAAIFLVLMSPAFAKQKVKVKISTDDYPLKNKAISAKLQIIHFLDQRRCQHTRYRNKRKDQF